MFVDNNFLTFPLPPLFIRESEDTALFMLKEIYTSMGIRPVMPGTSGGFSGTSLPPSRESSLPPRQGVGPPPPSSSSTMGGYSKNVVQPPPPMSSGSFLPPASSPGTAFQSVPHVSEFQQPSHHNQLTGPPPAMFSPSSVPSGHMQPGARRSPYVPPDFSNLPPNPITSSSGAAAPPPMGPAPVGGYRKTKPL